MRILSIVGWIVWAAILAGTFVAIAAIGAPIILIVAAVFLFAKGF